MGLIQKKLEHLYESLVYQYKTLQKLTLMLTIGFILSKMCSNMPVEHRCGYIITVPDGNGYDRETFRSRVVDHLRQLTGASISVPALSVIVELAKGKQVGQSRPPDDRTFGVQATISGEWWTDAYRKQDTLVDAIQNHYGLKATPADVRYEGDRVTVRFTTYSLQE